MARFKPMELIDKMSGKNQDISATTNQPIVISLDSWFLTPYSLLQKIINSGAFFCVSIIFCK